MSDLAQQKYFSLGKINLSTALRKASLFSVERHDGPEEKEGGEGEGAPPGPMAGRRALVNRAA